MHHLTDNNITCLRAIAQRGGATRFVRLPADPAGAALKLIWEGYVDVAPGGRRARLNAEGQALLATVGA